MQSLARRRGSRRRCARFDSFDGLRSRAPMARPVEFPRARHIALCGPGQAEAEARADGADAIIRPFEESEPDAPHPPLPEPQPPEGALPAATAEPALHAGAQEDAPAATGSPPPPPATASFPRLIAVDISRARDEHEACRKPDGSLVQDGSVAVRCVSSTAGREHAGRVVAWATHLGEGVLLEGLDRWYRAGPAEAGWCKSCEFALMESLRESYGDHLLTFDALEGLRTRGTFAGAREALRLSEAVESGKRAALRARDEARRGRGVEISVLGRTGPISAVALALARHLDGLLFDLPTADPEAALLPFLVARAALDQRPAVAVLPAAIDPAKVQLFSALALACDVDVMLPPSASAAARAALATHRRFPALLPGRVPPSGAVPHPQSRPGRARHAPAVPGHRPGTVPAERGDPRRGSPRVAVRGALVARRPSRDRHRRLGGPRPRPSDGERQARARRAAHRGGRPRRLWSVARAGRRARPPSRPVGRRRSRRRPLRHGRRGRKARGRRLPRGSPRHRAGGRGARPRRRARPGGPGRPGRAGLESRSRASRPRAGAPDAVREGASVRARLSRPGAQARRPPRQPGREARPGRPARGSGTGGGGEPERLLVRARAGFGEGRGADRAQSERLFVIDGITGDRGQRAPHHSPMTRKHGSRLNRSART